MVEIRHKLRSFIEDIRSSGLYRLPSERELANRLGCSRMTVSKALAHMAGEGLIERRQGSGTYIVENSKDNRLFNIGICLRGRYHSKEQHFLRLISEVSRQAQPLNLHLQIFDNLIDLFARDRDNNTLMKSIRAGIVDALLFISRMPVHIVGAARNTGIPVASVNGNAFGYMDIPSVCCDYYRVGFLAARHLIENGHKRIGLLTGRQMDHPELLMSVSGLHSACEAMGVNAFNERGLCHYESGDTRQLMRFIKQYKPTALYARSDMIAARALVELTSSGFSVPKDMSIVGTGNYSWGNQPTIGLTTIDTRLDEACTRGLKLIRTLALGDKAPTAVEMLGPTLIERQSVCEPARRASTN